MQPAPGERGLRFVGDTIQFSLTADGAGRPLPEGFQARLRTNLGRAPVLRREIIQSYAGHLPLAGASWRDVPLQQDQDGVWRLSFALTEVGFVRAKAYALGADGRQHWPPGPDVGICVHPSAYRTANIIYCAFPRMFGDSRFAARTEPSPVSRETATLDEKNFTVIPPSGKLRDVTRQLPHIMGALGCRILHLLPVNPTPTTRARFGRFGSPYAAQDLTAIDPALVEFDKRTTGVDQFCELAYAVHLGGGRVFLDIVINHTGWGSCLQEEHPDWFLRDGTGTFVSPGAWGIVWEDLVELNHKNPASWDTLAEMFLVWCRRGVDGFRCDAGYMVPMHAWRYITARVRQEFPETVFLLEGLGGSWEATEHLLTDGGMQWAYSELFQNYSGGEVAWYLEYALKQCRRVGLYVHYSETHDNNRLAERGREWSLLRNRLCALTSVSGGYGFTCGVEWLAAEKINVHSCRGLSWGAEQNIIPELTALNRLLAEHPCFFDDAELTVLSEKSSHVFALQRVSSEGLDRVLVLVNTDLERAHAFEMKLARWPGLVGLRHELLEQPLPLMERKDGHQVFHLPPGAAFCLSPLEKPAGVSGDDYRRLRGCAAFAMKALSHRLQAEQIGPCHWRQLASLVQQSPARFLGCLASLQPERAAVKPAEELDRAMSAHRYPEVVVWRLPDRNRVVCLPAGHWLLIEDGRPFRAALQLAAHGLNLREESIEAAGRHIACFPPQRAGGDATLHLERYADSDREVTGSIRLIPFESSPRMHFTVSGDRWRRTAQFDIDAPIALMTNGRGGMARMGVNLGGIKSKYDCVLAANLHPAVPVDRHVFVKRIRVWSVADGFITPLDEANLHDFNPGPPAHWRFVANAGDGRTVEFQLDADMIEGSNTTALRFTRSPGPPPLGRELASECRVSLTVRVDIEDRNFHWETRRNSGADHHFATHCRPLDGDAGFVFTPAQDRHLRVLSDGGVFHPEPEWSENISHPVERSRGQTGSGDAYSPGWFELPLAPGECVTLRLSAEKEVPDARDFIARRQKQMEAALSRAGLRGDDVLGRRLAAAVQAFIVRRDENKTVIAGYPWFLDWGRDSLICARGLLAAGMNDEVRRLLRAFGRFERDGTLPNSIHGEDASNRDTSDAPLWYGIVCEDLARIEGPACLDEPVDAGGRPIKDVLRAIAEGYLRGTPNGIRVDPDSGLVWSPSHFTWMDTNHPAGTPRAGYPVEIQVLWIRLLRLLDRLGFQRTGESWASVVERATKSFHELFWLEERGYLSDVLLAGPHQPASQATRDNALRGNGLFAVSFQVLDGERAQRCVEAALRHLLVPGALRSLAPLPVSPPLPVHGPHGLLNNPDEPYLGCYEGDEDTRRKIAYHNGTAWTWTLPTLCEALARAWSFQPEAVQAARCYLRTTERLLDENCLGHIPEILDGDAPHIQRGCDAQAWGATEALRVWKLLHEEIGTAAR